MYHITKVLEKCVAKKEKNKWDTVVDPIIGRDKNNSCHVNFLNILYKRFSQHSTFNVVQIVILMVF